MTPATSTDRRAAIVSAALALADREGLAALNMRRLATEVGVATMTLYGYFATKEELLDALVEHAATEYEPPAPGDGPWDERLRQIARGWHQGLMRHPGLVQARLKRPLMGPQVLRGTEAGVGALVEAGFSRSDAARAFRLLFLYVFGAAAFNDREVTEERRRQVGVALLSLPAEHFALLPEMPGEMAATLGGEAQFEFGLTVLIAGLQATLARPG